MSRPGRSAARIGGHYTTNRAVLEGQQVPIRDNFRVTVRRAIRRGGSLDCLNAVAGVASRGRSGSPTSARAERCRPQRWTGRRATPGRAARPKRLRRVYTDTGAHRVAGRVVANDGGESVVQGGEDSRQLMPPPFFPERPGGKGEARPVRVCHDRWSTRRSRGRERDNRGHRAPV